MSSFQWDCRKRGSFGNGTWPLDIDLMAAAINVRKANKTFSFANDKNVHSNYRGTRKLDTFVFSLLSLVCLHFAEWIREAFC